MRLHPLRLLRLSAAVAAATAAVVVGGCGTVAPSTLRGAFGRTDLFGAEILSAPLSPTSATLVSALVEQYHRAYGTFGINQVPVFTVPAGQPGVAVSVEPGCGDFRAGTGSVPIPPGAYTTSDRFGADAAMVVAQPATRRVWELWRATDLGGRRWSACNGGRLDAGSGNGVFPRPYGLSATGISYAATTVTEADVAAGAIHHALALVVTRCDHSVPPAVRDDCGDDPGQPPEGTWFRLARAAVLPPGLTRFARMVATALTTYGMVVVDRGGAVVVQAEDVRDWATTGHTGTDPVTASWGGRPAYSALDGIPWGDLEVVCPRGACRGS